MVKNNKKMIPLAVLACLSVFALMAKEGCRRGKCRNEKSESTATATRMGNTGTSMKENGRRDINKTQEEKNNKKKRGFRKNKKNDKKKKQEQN